MPEGYHAKGVPVPSQILQRILREYKNLSKRIIITGSNAFIHLQTDARFSLHRSDNLFGVMDENESGENIVTMELSISTLGRIQKITQFSNTVYLSCEVGLPVRFMSPIGQKGSCIEVFLEQDNNKS